MPWFAREMRAADDQWHLLGVEDHADTNAALADLEADLAKVPCPGDNFRMRPVSPEEASSLHFALEDCLRERQ